MNDIELKRLCLKLVKAESEDAVFNIIKSNPILKNDTNWKKYGDVENNIGTVTGQSIKSVPSLVEKITNSIDAILIKACRSSGLDPESPECPDTIEEAVNRFFGLNEKVFSDDPKKRRQFAERIQIIAEGSKKNPNIIIFDQGEGQHPSTFPKTLLSLHKSNKANIKFVQGKYNMGGTAVLPFCVKNRYQLIISRRYLSDNVSNQPIGFTLVRRNRGEGKNVKCSWYEYCVDDSGKIFQFTCDSLDLGLFNTNFIGGTYIKLFNYDLPNRSDITLDLWRDLNRFLFKPALPIILYEKRPYKGKSNTKIMHGNRARAMIDDRNSVEKIFTMEINSSKIKYPVEVYVFKSSVDKREFIEDMAIVFTNNGQVQHSLDNRYISSHAKKAYLKGSLLVHVNCSNMPRTLHEDIFHSSRSGMRDIQLYRDLLDSLFKELRDNEYLTQLDEQRRKEAILSNPKDESFLKNIMGKLIKDDSEFTKLLGLESGVISREIKNTKKQITGSDNKFKGKRFPTFFKFSNIKPGGVKMLPLDGQCIIKAETDAEDEFLIRPHDKGELKIKIKNPGTRAGSGTIKNPQEDDQELLDINIVGPNEGQIKLRAKPNRPLQVGTRIPIDLELSSPGGSFRLHVDIEIDKAKGHSNDTEIKKRKEYSLPQIIEVYKVVNEDDKDKSKSWAEYKWNESDICKVLESSSEGTLIDAIAINMDARELHNYIRSKKITGKNIENITRMYKVSVYFISLMLYFLLSQKVEVKVGVKTNIPGQELDDPVSVVSELMKGLSKILLHLTTNEHLLKEIEKSEL